MLKYSNSDAKTIVIEMNMDDKRFFLTKVRCLFVAMLIFCSAFVSYHITNGVETNRAPSISPIIVQDAEPRQEETEEPLSDDIIDYEITFDSVPEACEAKKRTFFLKTHKTASSVIENIMFRYGKSNNKTFAMPKDGGLVFKYQVPFKKQMMFPLPHQPDVLASHIRWSPDADELFDKDSSFRFTIVRSPAKLFPSIFNYFQRLNPIFKQARTLERFLANPQQFTAESKKPQFTTRNSMSFQMGGDMYLNRDPSDEELDAIRASLADKFDLILVADHLPQSLILLRHQLCLSINDIASMSKNVAKRAPSRIDLTDQINKWQTVDSVIFAEANRTLWERVEQFGLGRMRDEVEALTRRNEQLNEECVKSYKPVKQLPREFQDYEPPGVRIDGIELNDDVEQLCTDIALSPFAHAIDIQDNQCQDSTFLRKFARLESRAKTIHPWCSSKN